MRNKQIQNVKFIAEPTPSTRPKVCKVLIEEDKLLAHKYRLSQAKLMIQAGKRFKKKSK